MEEPVFKLPRVGWVGQRPVDRTYMEEINRRAKRREAACRVPVERQQVIGDKRQLSLPFPRKKSANQPAVCRIKIGSKL